MPSNQIMGRVRKRSENVRYGSKADSSFSVMRTGVRQSLLADEYVQRQDGGHAHVGRIHQLSDPHVHGDAGDDVGLLAGIAVGFGDYLTAGRRCSFEREARKNGTPS